MENQHSTSSKDHLETEKLRLEVRSMKKQAWKKSEFWNVLITGFIGFASLLLLIKNGAFDFQSKELSYKRENLEWDIRKLEDEKDSVQKTINNFKSDSIRLMNQNDSLKNSNKILVVTRKELENINLLLQKNRKFQESEFAKIVSEKNKELDSIRLLSNQHYSRWLNTAMELAAKKAGPSELLLAEYRTTATERDTYKWYYLTCQKGLDELRVKAEERDMYKNKYESCERSTQELKRRQSP